MKPVLPFVSQASSVDCRDWVSVLNQAMPMVDVRAYEEMSLEDRRAAKVAVVANPDPSQLAELPALKWVQSVWAGVEQILNSDLNRDIKVVRLRDERLTATMVEAALAWTFYLHRDMPLLRRQQSQKLWQQQPVTLACDRVVGVLGLGELGSRVADKFSLNGFKVCGWSRTNKTKQVSEIEVFSGEKGLSDLLSQSNILVVLLPLTVETENLLNVTRLRELPQGASLINFARGPIVDEQGLIECLDRNLSHAVLDVFNEEPLPTEHPFWSHPNVTVLPHIAAPTDKRSAARIVAKNVMSFFDNGVIPESVDRQKGY